jgi:hypothetical protein
MSSAIRFLSATTLLLFASCESNHLLKEVKLLEYPSASAIEYFDNKLYVMGDDANYMLVLDSSFNIIDSLTFFDHPEKRIPKNVKPDLEAMTTIYAANESMLLSIGSGSLSPNRNAGYMLHYRTSEKSEMRLDSFYSAVSSMGIKEMNIEGLCALTPNLVLANRGNLSYRSNHLIITSLAVMSGRLQGPITLMRVGGNEDSTEFKGISGLAYSRKSDRLIMTVSTEATTNAMDDGEIGKSYLWIIRNFNSKRNWKAVNPDVVIDLEEVDARFKKQKIESVCIVKETRDFMHLVLAADNDNGSSTLFRVVIEK